MRISITYDFDSEEEYKDFMAKSAEALQANQSKGILEKPVSMEQLEKAAEAVENKADSSEDKPKKAKATKSTPKEEKPAPEAHSEEKKVDSEMVRAILFDLRQMGKKAEVKKLFEEFGVSKLSEIKEEQYVAVFDAATAIKNAG